MGDNSAIVWTDASWNPIVGCSILSAGCIHCYAMGEAARQVRMAAGAGRVSPYDGLTNPSKVGPVWNGKLRLREDILDLPMRWSKPRRIFVNSMGDLFHEDVPDEWLDPIFTTMALAGQHTFQVLTKRPERARDYLRRRAERMAEQLGVPFDYAARPLKNVWIGVSAEDQATFDERWPVLAEIPAFVRWFSFEPLLGPIDPWRAFATGLFHWAVAGGESGPRARPCHPDWVRVILITAEMYGVAFLLKQWGEWAPFAELWRAGLPPGPLRQRGEVWLHRETGERREDLRLDEDEPTPPEWALMDLVGKQRAGRTLDGVVHDSYPQHLEAA